MSLGLFALALQTIGRLVPSWLPHGSAVGNRLLKPLYRAVYGQTWTTAMIWDGVAMRVNPCEGVGGNLFFSPQLYDREERAWIAKHVGQRSVFVDVGANIGGHTLWALACMGSDGKIVAIEADPENFRALQRNIELNTADTRVTAINMGVSDVRETLPFYRNVRGNNGGHSFLRLEGHVFAGELQVQPLHGLLVGLHLHNINFMKMDIEGFELRTLTKFFDDCARIGPDLRPAHLLLELEEGPLRGDVLYRKHLLDLLADNGYKRMQTGMNALFSLTTRQVGRV